LAGPTIVLAAIFTAIYPEWIGSVLSVPAKSSAPFNFWPWLILPGLILLVWAMRTGRLTGAGLATGLVTPYLAFYSWSGAMVLAGAETPWLAVTLTVLSWAVTLLKLRWHWL
jgi:hypothetical protein